MQKGIRKKKLGRKKAHREALVRNLVRSLFDNNYVVTTTTKAKVLKQEASSLIEKGKSKTEELVFRRELTNIFGNDDLVKKYKDYLKKKEIGVGFVRVGFRKGDNAQMSRVFLLGLDKKKAVVKKSTKKEEKEKEKDQKLKTEAKTPLDIKDEKPVGLKKKVDKTAVIKKKNRAKARAGL
jgi:large subunit ribosomal protein L17